MTQPSYLGMRVLKKWDDGYKMVRLTKPEHLSMLALQGGGCCADHAYWVCAAKPRGEYFFVLMDKMNEAKTILFCKRSDLYGKVHPQDGAPFRKWCQQHGIRPWIMSNYYDRGGSYLLQRAENEKRELVVLERRLEEARATYEDIKKRALRIGPLNRDHPMKYDVDEYNRRIVEYNGALERARDRMRLHTGMQFRYLKVNLIILEVAGRGINYDPGKSRRYTDRVSEWLSDCKERYGDANT